MGRSRMVGWVLFYIGIILSIIVTYFFLQDRFGHNYPPVESHIHSYHNADYLWQSISEYDNTGFSGAING